MASKLASRNGRCADVGHGARSGACRRERGARLHRRSARRCRCRRRARPLAGPREDARVLRLVPEIGLEDPQSGERGEVLREQALLVVRVVARRRRAAQIGEPLADAGPEAPVCAAGADAGRVTAPAPDRPVPRAQRERQRRADRRCRCTSSATVGGSADETSSCGRRRQRERADPGSRAQSPTSASARPPPSSSSIKWAGCVERRHVDVDGATIGRGARRHDRPGRVGAHPSPRPVRRRARAARRP